MSDIKLLALSFSALLAIARSLTVLGLASLGAQTLHQSSALPKFLGREVVVNAPNRESEPDPGPAPRPAKVCVEGPPQEQCFAMPSRFGWSPSVKVVQLSKDKPALLFTATTGGVTGWDVHFSLLTPGAPSALDDLLPNVSLGNQSQTTFWSEPELSDAKIFVTADALWGPGEGHYDEHRYEISAYLWDKSSYSLADRYITSRWYDLQRNADILGSERPEIIARLKKVVPGIRQRISLWRGAQRAAVTQRSGEVRDLHQGFGDGE